MRVLRLCHVETMVLIILKAMICIPCLVYILYIAIPDVLFMTLSCVAFFRLCLLFCVRLHLYSLLLPLWLWLRSPVSPCEKEPRLLLDTASAGNNCSTTWQRPLAPADSTCPLHAPDWSVGLTSCVSDALIAAWPSTVNADGGNIDNSLVWSHDNRLLWSFARHMSLHSSRPAADLLGHISGCKVKLQYPDLDELAQLLKGADSLKRLEVSSCAHDHVTHNSIPLMSFTSLTHKDQEPLVR